MASRANRDIFRHPGGGGGGAESELTRWNNTIQHVAWFNAEIFLIFRSYHNYRRKQCQITVRETKCQLFALPLCPVTPLLSTYLSCICRYWWWSMGWETSKLFRPGSPHNVGESIRCLVVSLPLFRPLRSVCLLGPVVRLSQTRASVILCELSICISKLRDKGKHSLWLHLFLTVWSQRKTSALSWTQSNSAPPSGHVVMFPQECRRQRASLLRSLKWRFHGSVYLHRRRVHKINRDDFEEILYHSWLGCAHNLYCIIQCMAYVRPWRWLKQYNEIS